MCREAMVSPAIGALLRCAADAHDDQLLLAVMEWLFFERASWLEVVH